MGGEGESRARSAAQALMRRDDGAAEKLEQLTDTELAVAVQYCYGGGGTTETASSSRECIRVLLDARLAEGARQHADALVKATEALESTLREAAEANSKLARRIGIATIAIMAVGVVVAFF